MWAKQFRGASSLLLAAVALAACSSSSTSSSSSTTATVPANEVRIGLEGPLTGSQSAVGRGMLHGAQLAASELNAKGGIDGKRVTIVPIDDAASPSKGVAAAKAAIAHGLTAVVGPYNSGVGIKTLPLYLKAGLVPLRLTSATSTEGLGFTLQPMTNQIAPVATKAITTWLGATSVGIIYDPTQAYTSDANTAMRSDLKAAGVSITSDLAISPGKSSYASAVSEVEATNPQVVYVITYYPEGGLIAQAMYQAKGSAKCLADYGAYDTGFITAAGVAAAESCPIVGVPAPNDFPNSTAEVAAYAAKFKAAPGTWAPYAYDSVKILADAATKAGNFHALALTTTLDEESKWQGWTGSVSFEAKSGNRIPAPVVVDATDASGTFHIESSWATATGFAF
jgi:branched-chain amino acid transport system substrate-binding protein